ncbi:hypothetical protein PF010_g17872 [Phytophthora fragariae]|uniref:Fe2OG dioxygenase domain-containing protein n=1 Tax=Phytophthora fragariae TaxID=53985 RepID=A0A6G0KMC8_9STRA|nr:hypothetical protein PF010_g17872 [Phytophthora fragariae]KAE9223035.1 hypothetical protein PF004_g12640 [Phytophthora fragariae]
MSLDYMLSVPEEQFDLQEAYWPFTAMGEIDDECYLPKGETCIALSAALGRLAETRDDVFAFEDTNTRLPAVCGLKVKGSQVEMENPIWNVRLKELLHRVGIELGYGLVTLDAELEKLVVYEPGGRLMRHKCAEDVAGEVAKLVVQLPSMFTGGDLVVYSDEDSSKHCRMDMGKKADTAAYSPCCAVYVAGAEHAVEEVKNGYRVVLVYSLRVPEDEYSPGVTRAGQLVVREMCDSMAEFGEKESFALLLSTNYGYAGLEKKGIELLKDEDRRQFDALQKANALLPPEKQLKFYLVELNQSTELIRDVCTGGGAYYRNRGFEPVSRSGNGVVGTPWEVTGNSESSVWFSINGEKLRDWNFEHGGDPLQWSAT